MKGLFPDAPESLAALGDEALADLLASFQDVSRRLKAGEIDLVEAFGDEMSDAERSAEAMKQWREAAEVVLAIKAEMASNEEARAAFDAEAAEIDAAFGTDDADAEVEAAADEVEPDGEAAADDGETLEAEETAEVVAEAEVAEGEIEQEAVLASAEVKPEKPRRVLYPSVPKRHRAEAETSSDKRAVLVASAGQVDHRAGTEFDALGYAQAVIDMARRRGKPSHVAGGGEERILLASAALNFPDERRLISGDNEGNMEKIRKLGSPWLGEESRETLLAAGGVCNPPTPFYDLPDMVTTDRPIRDGLPGYQADRGGVAVPSVSGIGDITSAITVIEEADDALGGTFATKSCQDFDCAEWTETFVGAIAHCRKYGNLTARSWPEGVAHENRLTMAAWARTAEGRLLDRIDALVGPSYGTTAVYGALSTFIYRLSVARAGIISRERMDKNTRFTVILPFWAATMMSLDIVNSQNDDRLDYANDAISGVLSRFGFNTIWHLDEGIDPGADAEIFAAQDDGSVQVDWPGSIVVARLFPAAQFLYLDGGSLELGLVRDSELNSTNDYELFGESWENIARVGPENAAQRIEIAVCPTGIAAPTNATAFACSAS